jgi:hypothetical protein
MRLPGCAILLCLFTLTCWSQQTPDTTPLDLHSYPNEAPHAPVTEVFADVLAHLTKADATQRGELWLVVSADSAADHVQLRIPLSSTEDAYGESRSCTRAPDGSDALVFTAGRDEKNFVRFTPATSDKEFHLLLNKYLCRALAAAFHCGSRPVTLTVPWDQWRIARRTWLELSSDAPATLQLASSSILQTSTPFDDARCAITAPSGGLCCVGGKTTQWHCGGTPSGQGWHQISGDCFHRETGGSCKD